MCSRAPRWRSTTSRSLRHGTRADPARGFASGAKRTTAGESVDSPRIGRESPGAKTRVGRRGLSWRRLPGVCARNARRAGTPRSTCRSPCCRPSVCSAPCSRCPLWFLSASAAATEKNHREHRGHRGQTARAQPQAAPGAAAAVKAGKAARVSSVAPTPLAWPHGASRTRLGVAAA
jgi:hypothetical protein